MDLEGIKTTELIVFSLLFPAVTVLGFVASGPRPLHSLVHCEVLIAGWAAGMAVGFWRYTRTRSGHSAGGTIAIAR